MNTATLAAQHSADELLAALCAKLDPAHAIAAVRAITPFLNGEDKATRARRLGAERSKRRYYNRKAASHAQA